MAQHMQQSPSASLGDRLFRDPDTGRPAVLQWPNIPLWIFLALTLVRLVLHPEGDAGTVVSVVSALALLWWSVGEVGWGDSLFRRVLGALVLLGLVVGVVRR